MHLWRAAKAAAVYETGPIRQLIRVLVMREWTNDMLRGRALDMQHDAWLIHILNSAGEKFVQFINGIFALN